MNEVNSLQWHVKLAENYVIQYYIKVVVLHQKLVQIKLHEISLDISKVNFSNYAFIIQLYLQLFPSETIDRKGLIVLK